MKKKLNLFAVSNLLLLLSPLSVLAAGLPNIEVTLQRNKIHHAGVAVFLDFMFTNNSNKTVSIYLDANPFEHHANVIADGEIYSLAGGADFDNITLAPGESVKRSLYVDKVPYNTKSFDSIKLGGRSSVTTEKNPYGEFFYSFQNIEIPMFPNSNRPKCYFLDNEFDLSVNKIIPNGKDLEISFILTNNGKRNKYVTCNKSGKATDDDGDEYTVEDARTYMSVEVPSGESITRKVIVKDGAKRNLKKVRIMYDISETGIDKFSYPVLLQLDNVSVE